MLHPDVEIRIGAHQIFSVLLVPSSNNSKRSVYNRPRRWHSNTASTFASVAALLERLRREKDGTKIQKHGMNVRVEFKDRDVTEEEWKQGRALKNSPNFNKISSIIDKTAGSSSLTAAEPSTMKFSEDQIAQLLSAFWVQANLTDNLPSNVEAIAHSYSLTVISLRLKNHSNSLVVRLFQLPLSLKNMSLDPNNGMWPPVYQRLILMLSTAMLMFAAKLYQISDLNDLVMSLVERDVDPYLTISDDFQLFVKPQADVREYGSVTDNQLATSLLSDLQKKICDSDKTLMDILVRNLSSIVEMDADCLFKQLLEPFTPEDAFMFGPQSILDLDHIQMIVNSKEALSCDGDFQTNSIAEDDVTSESSVADLSRFIPKMPASPAVSHVVSIGQLLESALEVAGQVAGTCVSTSPLPYSTMASQCEALGLGTRKKLSCWLTHENHQTKPTEKPLSTFSADGWSEIRKICNDGGPVQGAKTSMDSWLALRLPPASPFDNFLRAARY